MKNKIESSHFIPEIFDFKYNSCSFPTIFLKYENGEFKCEHLENKESIVPSEEEWSRFWKKLDKINAWDWSEEYVIPEYMYVDGDSWNIKIHLGDKKIECRGSNAYPGSDGEIVQHKMIFRRFFMAVKKLLDVKTIDIDIESIN